MVYPARLLIFCFAFFFVTRKSSTRFCKVCENWKPLPRNNVIIAGEIISNKKPSTTEIGNYNSFIEGSIYTEVVYLAKPCSIFTRVMGTRAQNSRAYDEKLIMLSKLLCS